MVYRGKEERMRLRDYQIDIRNKIVSTMKEGNKRVLLQCPTGGGKTVTFSEIVLSADRMGKRVYVFVHRKELIEQISAAFAKFLSLIHI